MRLLARAPGKVNLCLFLGPVRTDGRHELVTVFESVSLADEVTIETVPTATAPAAGLGPPGDLNAAAELDPGDPGPPSPAADQVVCPGVVRTEFHTRQGLDMSGRSRMEPADVVAASLEDLEHGVVVSVPGLEDERELDAVTAAQAALAASTGTVERASRYQR